MLMRQFRSLVIQLLALSVLADAFALRRDQRTSLAQSSESVQSSDSRQDQTPSETAAQHITKIPRTKVKVQSKTTEKPIETTTDEDDEVTTKEPVEAKNEIGGQTTKSIESLPEEHALGNDEVRTNVASNGKNNATPNANGTVDNTAPAESTSVTNNVTKDPEDPNWIPEAVTEINSDVSTDNVTVSITSVNSDTHYSTASVKDNEGILSTVSTYEDIRQQIISGNFSGADNSVSALVAEYTKNYTLAEATTEEPFRPYQGHISKDESNLELSRQDHNIFENDLKEEGKNHQENITLETKNNDTELPTITTNISTDNNTQSRSTDWLRRSDSDLSSTTLSAAYMKYSKVISKEERFSSSELANYGDKLEPSSTKSSSVSKEIEGPLDDVSMDTSNTWRREDTAIVTSMRGGYLNHSPESKKDASTKPDEENETVPTKNTQAITSQGLMVDDQLKEEFLMEDRLSDKTQFIQGEDRPLSVKPIGKNNALYTVSPNYKPMKKLDVVPGKPQLRNPDDNSWRNQSLNNLGIVFKGNNSSKPFTQVLKNKTETELGNLVEKEEKPEAPELRERLEKLAEERKSKKKKTDKSSESTDYDEASNDFYRATTTGSARIASRPAKDEKATQWPPKNIFKTYDYENTDDDVEYVTLPYLDLKKSPTTKSPDRGTRPTTINWAQPTTKQIPGRKATVQYFPPKVYVKNDTEQDEFHRKMQAFVPEQDAPITTPNLVLRDKEVPTKALRTNFYLPDTPKPELSPAYRVPVDKAYSFRDIMTKIGHDDDYDREHEYIPVHKVKEALTQRQPTPIRKEVLEKYIQNYNDNSRKFRVDYPIVYNSRVFHTDSRDAPLASSSASMMQQYSASNTKYILEQKKKYDPNCEKVVELSADYELRYYVPEQEEKMEFGKIIR